MSKCIAAVFLLPNIQFVPCAHFFSSCSSAIMTKKEKKKTKRKRKTIIFFPKEKEKKKRKTNTKTYDITMNDVIYKITSP